MLFLERSLSIHDSLAYFIACISVSCASSHGRLCVQGGINFQMGLWRRLSVETMFGFKARFQEEDRN